MSLILKRLNSTDFGVYVGTIEVGKLIGPSQATLHELITSRGAILQESVPVIPPKDNVVHYDDDSHPTAKMMRENRAIGF